MTTKERVIAKLREYINGADFKKLEKSKPKIAEQLKNIKSENIDFSFPMSAKFFRGYFECNVRSNGYQYSGDFKNTRTINFNFTTKTIGFVDDDNTADSNALDVAAQLLGMHMYNLGAAKYAHLEQLGSEIYRQAECELALIRNAIPLCDFEHNKLDYTLDRSSIKILKSEFFREQSAELTICNIYANILDKKGKSIQIPIGYYAENAETDDSEGTIIICVDSLLGKSKNNKATKGSKISFGKIVKWILIASAIVSVIGIIISVVK